MQRVYHEYDHQQTNTCLIELLSFAYCPMITYTEGDIENALVDLEQGLALAAAATRHGVPRNTL